MEDKLAPGEKESLGKVETSAFALAVCVSLLLSVCFLVGGLPQGQAVSNLKIDGKVNPNTASIESLMRLDGIGASRAYDIVQYRQKCDRKKAFQTPDDLQAIRGIGPKTVEKIEHCLSFD